MNDIRIEKIETPRLSPMEALVRVTLSLPQAAEDIQIRGNMTGPTCPGTSTIEIAYPWRMMKPPSPNQIIVEAVIPEPNLWSPETPFTYHGRVDVWSRDKRIGTISFSHQLNG